VLRAIRYFLFISLAIIPLRSLADVNAAMAWLVNQNTGKGIYTANDIAEPYQTISELVELVSLASSTTTTFPFDDAELRSYLNSHLKPSDNTEILSRALLAGIDYDSAGGELLSQLVANQNTDGGFGGHQGFDSSIYDTSYAVAALWHKNISNKSLLQHAIKFICDRQEGHGGWSMGSNDVSPAVTARIISVLNNFREYPNVPAAIDLGVKYLLSKKEGPNGWGEIWENAEVSLSLMRTSSDPNTYSDVIVNLSSTQSANGSWVDDAYITAEALKAIVYASTIKFPVIDATSTISGSVYDGVSGFALPDVAITIEGNGDVVQSTSQQTGEFSVGGIAAGKYKITYFRPGYDLAVKDVNVEEKQVIHVGAMVLSPSVVTGHLSGVVSDRDTGAGLSASITLVGQQTYSVMTNPTGYYSLVVAPDSYEVSMMVDGYDSRPTSFSINSGQKVVFSPALSKMNKVGTTTILSGHVFDNMNAQPLADVAVVSSSGVSTSTDVAGRYELEIDGEGVVVVYFEKLGYQGVQSEILLGPGTELKANDVKLELLKDYGVISGTVLSANNNSPLPDVQLIFSGALDATLHPGSDGKYAIQSPVGSVTIDVNANGYAAITAVGDVVAGQNLNFSPRLVKDDSGTATVVTGVIVDSDTKAPIPNASVQIINELTGERSQVSADQNGVFRNESTSSEQVRLIASAQDYVSSTWSLVKVLGGIVDMGEMPLERVSVNRVFGIVSDRDTGKPISGALVLAVVDGDNYAYFTGSDGKYELNGMRATNILLDYRAVGYASNTVNLDAETYKTTEVNVQLVKTNQGQVEIGSLSTDRSQYSAYDDVLVYLMLLNSSDMDEEVKLYGVIYDQQAGVVQRFSPNLGENGNDYNVAAQSSEQVTFTWNSQSLTPGMYLIAVQVYDGLTGQILTEQSSSVELVETKAINIDQIKVRPGFSRINREEVVSIDFRLVNSSNVAFPIDVSYDITSPTGVLVKSGMLAHASGALKYVNDVSIDKFPFKFMDSGIYKVVLNVDGDGVEKVSGNEFINVAPEVRISPSVKMTPDVVTDDGDKRINIELELKGEETEAQ